MRLVDTVGSEQNHGKRARDHHENEEALLGIIVHEDASDAYFGVFQLGPCRFRQLLVQVLRAAIRKREIVRSKPFLGEARHCLPAPPRASQALQTSFDKS